MWRSDLRAYAASIPNRTNKALGRAGKLGEAVARARARVRTGRMRGRIEYSARTDSLEGRVPYTVFHEFGTRYVRAQPMLRPGADVIASRIPEEFDRAFNE